MTDYVLLPQRPNRGNFIVQSALDEAVNQASPEVNILSNDYAPNVRYDPNLIKSLQNQIVNNSIQDRIVSRGANSSDASNAIAQAVAPVDMTQEQKIQALTELRQNPTLTESDNYFGFNSPENKFNNTIKEYFPNLTEQGVEAVRNQVDNNLRLQRDLDRRYRNLQSIQAENDRIVRSNRELQELGIPNLEQTKSITNTNPTNGSGNTPNNIINETVNNTTKPSTNTNSNTFNRNALRDAEEADAAIQKQYENMQLMNNTILSDREAVQAIGQQSGAVLDSKNQAMIEQIQSKVGSLRNGLFGGTSFGDVAELYAKGTTTTPEAVKYLMKRMFYFDDPKEEGYREKASQLDRVITKYLNEGKTKGRVNAGDVAMAILSYGDPSNWGTDINGDLQLPTGFTDKVLEAHNQKDSSIRTLQDMQKMLKAIESYSKSVESLQESMNNTINFNNRYSNITPEELANDAILSTLHKKNSEKYNQSYKNYNANASKLFKLLQDTKE